MFGARCTPKGLVDFIGPLLISTMQAGIRIGSLMDILGWESFSHSCLQSRDAAAMNAHDFQRMYIYVYKRKHVTPKQYIYTTMHTCPPTIRQYSSCLLHTWQRKTNELSASLFYNHGALIIASMVQVGAKLCTVHHWSFRSSTREKVLNDPVTYMLHGSLVPHALRVTLSCLTLYGICRKNLYMRFFLRRYFHSLKKPQEAGRCANAEAQDQREDGYIACRLGFRTLHPATRPQSSALTTIRLSAYDIPVAHLRKSIFNRDGAGSRRTNPDP